MEVGLGGMLDERGGELVVEARDIVSIGNDERRRSAECMTVERVGIEDCEVGCFMSLGGVLRCDSLLGLIRCGSDCRLLDEGLWLVLSSSGR